MTPQNYHVLAFRWGYMQEQSCLFSSSSLDDCYTVAEHYPGWRGGKYGCGVYRSPSVEDGMEGEGDGTALHYFPSIHGETEPSYNHRCDVFNRVVCIIQAHPKYKECGWIAEIIEAASAFADRMNKAQAERRTETMTKHHCQGEDGA